MHAAAGLADDDLRRECDVVALLVAEVADDPLGHEQLVGALICWHGEELDLVLLIAEAVLGEVAHLGVAVLDAAATLGDELHAARTEVVGLGEGSRLVVALLVRGGEGGIVGFDDVVLQLAHGLEFHARDFVEGLHGLSERMLRCGGQRLAVAVEVVAEQAECRDLLERVDEGRAEDRHHVEVAAGCLDGGEERAAVHALTTGEDGVEIIGGVEHEVERLQSSVAAGVHQIDHADVEILHDANDIFLGEVLRGLAQMSGHAVSRSQKIVCHLLLVIFYFGFVLVSRRLPAASACAAVFCCRRGQS